MEPTLILISVAYAVFSLLVFLGNQKENRRVEKSVTPNKLSFITILVAARNEEKNIGHLIQALEKQRYSKELLELIIIDDHSEDATANVVRSNAYPWLKLLHLPKNKKGKKAALRFGASHARGELLLFTDADCIPDKNWVNAMYAHYMNYQSVMVLGHVEFAEGNGFLGKFQQIEMQALQNVSSGFAGLGIPIMANGANMLVEANLFKTLDLREEVASGDDIFALLELAKIRRVSYCGSREASVKTKPAESVIALINQKARWASKNKYIANITYNLVGIIVVLENLAVALALVWLFISGNYVLSAIIFGIKLMADLAIAKSRKSSLNMRFGNVLMFELIYPFYMLLILFYSQFGKLNWKGRPIK